VASITFYRNRWVVRWYRAEGRPKKSFLTREEAEAHIDMIDERPRKKTGPKGGARPVAERIQALVKVDPNGCWLWQGKRMATEGYGVMTINRRGTMAHRASYEAFIGPIPAGLQLDHLCRVRECVNPKHLEPVTARVNVLRSPVAQASLNAAKTHCPRDHEYTPENTYLYGPHGRWRLCRTCIRERARARYASKRGN
jgi:hypothetical protein